VVFPIGDNPLVVFYATVSKVGFLPPPLASKVVRFYGEAVGVVVDFRTIYKEKSPDEFSKQIFGKRLAMRVRALAPEAKALVAELRDEGDKTWSDYLSG